VPVAFTERLRHRALIAIALSGLIFGGLLYAVGQPMAAKWLWAAGTVPVVIGLFVSMARDLMAGRMGVDAVAFVSMSAALLLGQSLAGVVVAVMYAGGNLLEDFAVARAERDLKSLTDRAPRIAHRRHGDSLEDVAIEDIAVGDTVLVRAGEVIPVRRPALWLTNRQYARLVQEWVASIGLAPAKFGTHSLRRTKAVLIYRQTGNLRAVQLLLGHSREHRALPRPRGR